MHQGIAALLGLQSWIVYRVERGEGAIEVFVGKPRKEACCPACGARTRRVWGRARGWRRVLHTWCGGLPVYLRVRPRRFRCGQCRKVFVERFAGIRPWGRCTEQAEQVLLRELAGRSFRSTAVHLQVGVGVLRRVVLRRVAPQIDLQAAVQDLPELSLSLDEHSFRHQDMAVTLTAVVPDRQVLALLPDDRKRTVEAFFRQMPEEVRGRVRAVCVDLKDTWRKLLRRVLPQAQVVADPFHVIQDANRRVDEARRIEQELRRRKIPRWPLLKNQEDLTPKQAEVLRAIYRQYPTLAHFHWAKEQLRAFYRAPSFRHAQALLDRLLFSLQHADDAELVRWGRTLHAWKAELLSYHRHRVTSAYTEGIHTKIKLLKRLSYGFRNRHMYVRKMLLGLVPLAFLLRPPHLLT
ncbi:MAG: ISL3 family transposase [bacterium]